MKHKQYVTAQKLFQQALAQEQAEGTADRQASVLKASGDALVLQGRALEAGRTYQQAMILAPASAELVVVRHTTTCGCPKADYAAVYDCVVV